jgi:hypothetical protein
MREVFSAGMGSPALRQAGMPAATMSDYLDIFAVLDNKKPYLKPNFMKKLLIILLLAISTGVSYGQGLVFFDGESQGVWDNFSSSEPILSADMKVSFMFGTGTPLISSLEIGAGADNPVPTNALPGYLGFDPYGAWIDILHDPNFLLATNTSLPGSPVVASVIGNGSWGYNSSTEFHLAGASQNQTYTVYVIAWADNYATPQLAAAADAAVGWSDAFSYTIPPLISEPSPSFVQAGFLPFGVVGTPEPGDCALAGLGGLSLWFLRRRSAGKGFDTDGTE